MNKIYKIFGAAAIVGLFMLGSALTVLAAPQEGQGISQPAQQVPPGEEGLIPANLAFVDVDPITKTNTLSIKVTVQNKGFGCAWMPWKMHIVVDKLLFKNPEDTFWCYGPVFPTVIKTFESKNGLADIIPRHVEVWLDITNLVFEGFLGETDNYGSFWV